jgi:hypothetical protein
MTTSELIVCTSSTHRLFGSIAFFFSVFRVLQVDQIDSYICSYSRELQIKNLVFKLLSLGQKNLVHFFN